MLSILEVVLPVFEPLAYFLMGREDGKRLLLLKALERKALNARLSKAEKEQLIRLRNWHQITGRPPLKPPFKKSLLERLFS